MRICYAREKPTLPGTVPGLPPGHLPPTAAEAIQAAEAMQRYRKHDQEPAKGDTQASGWAPKEFDEAAIEAQAGEKGKADADDGGGFVYDEASGYYYDAASGYFYDPNS